MGVKLDGMIGATRMIIIATKDRKLKEEKEAYQPYICAHALGFQNIAGCRFST